MNDETISVEFEKPRFATAPGQSVVFYEGAVCLGGAVIDKAFNS
jgi:tRNA-specific 2-thiouridylase